MNTFIKLKDIFSHYWIKFCIALQVFYHQPALAQLGKITLPDDIEVDGVDGDSNIVDIFIAVVKVFGTVTIWIIIIVSAVTFLKNTIKSVNKVMSGRGEDGGAKWGEVIGDIIGNAFIVVLILLVSVLGLSYL